MSTDQAAASWAPQACTLPTAQVPLRVAEFDDLFSQSMHEVERLDVTRLRLVLTGGDPTEAVTRDLTARESECCSFFDFHLDRKGDHVVLEVRVSPAHVEVLDGLATRAASARVS